MLASEFQPDVEEKINKRVRMGTEKKERKKKFQLTQNCFELDCSLKQKIKTRVSKETKIKKVQKI